MNPDTPEEIIDYGVALKTAGASYAGFVAGSPPGPASEIDAKAAHYVDSTAAGVLLGNEPSSLNEAELRVIEQVRRESSGPDETVD